MRILLDLFNLSVYVPFWKADEEDIGRNIKHLKQYNWFQGYFTDSIYRDLIIQNKNVRQCIGRFNVNKLNKQPYQRRCQENLRKVLQKNGVGISS
ncbi:hypothetical protein [Radiobacillus deserti]|uniref:Uncharacterized protein n=1 Tax=Radiobacillus deserti TaxID=2594883 RepID=A0A516KDP8_9BACI|nr:hypothetical protein [Radiobacillus deserti]QDP39521.1 hypothetical protein FN924_04620 [Radiobacillus deserti]